MTEKEAIKIAIHCLNVQAEQEVCEECPIYIESGIACKEVDRAAISALGEIQQYREIGTVEYFKKLKLADNGTIWGFIDEYVAYKNIGTVEECREAVEKQKLKKPVLRMDNGRLCKSCSVCGCFFSLLSRSCPKCGQAIYW